MVCVCVFFIFMEHRKAQLIVVLEKLGIEPVSPCLQGILHHGGKLNVLKILNFRHSTLKYAYKTQIISSLNGYMSLDNQNINQRIYHNQPDSISCLHRSFVKNVYPKNIFLISQPKHMLWVLKKNVSMTVLLSTKYMCSN